ncbi:hypothetical protein GCM10028822_34870 [Hymenobacter terrigena]
MNKLNIDLSAIRPLNGDKKDGFEELCAQLARVEKPTKSRFERKGTPDAGVECFAVLEDGSEWGWQSKYFDSFGSSQWQQLDESVKTALKKHPNLVRYFICVPLDRPDGRIDKRQSAMQTWNGYVQKWTGLAQAKGMTVEFTYWGSHEIINLLTKPVNVGRVRFWFDTKVFDENWFKSRLEETIDTAGTRYTPELNLNLPIAEKFEAFGRTEGFFNGIKALAKDIRETHRRLYPSKDVVEESGIESALTELTSSIGSVLSHLGSLQLQPIGELPLTPIIELISSTRECTDKIERQLLEQEFKSRPERTKKTSDTDPFRSLRYDISRLTKSLREANNRIWEARSVANHSLMILSGAAGSGKTHLLCDIAKDRVAAGRPTLLLMGQLFIGTEGPWIQALQQLDLAMVSVEEVVGALESAAQVANSRLLLMVDAINEGNGRAIWPSNVASFLVQAFRSPWLGIVLSVRSSYKDYILPQSVRDQACQVTHEGFSGHEYDATKAFFIHYGLELPSTPLLAPEFQNPLFLKTLCEGLKAKNLRRLPRGFHGITATFDLYLTGINKKLSESLDYQPKQNLVSRALEEFAQEVAKKDERWLTLTEATAVVDKLLPNRDFRRSLYHGLVTEGVLIEEAPHSGHSEERREEVVFISYERLADHLWVKVLLDTHLTSTDAASDFAEGAPLALIWNTDSRFQSGLLEAMFIQVPERTNRELSELAPAVIEYWNADAFRQSIVWRSTKAFSDRTRDALNEFNRTDNEWAKTLDMLLTVATLPDHPFNAGFLDRKLRTSTMPERDAWWSIDLHNLWDRHSAVDRLVDWSSAITASTVLDEPAVDLCAVALAWMLTSSNRFLRDRATKGLISLLTGKLEAAGRLVERFADVDDPYVTERIYAVAYGVAMRSNDKTETGKLAFIVYNRVFADKRPPVHILLRDYARGVIERALFLEADISIEVKLIRPPYVSSWPTIPTDEEIALLFPEVATGESNGRETWGRDRIKESVIHDDFSRYVIEPAIDDWLAILLNEPEWTIPKSTNEQLEDFAENLSEIEQEAWSAFQQAKEELEAASYRHLKKMLDEQEELPKQWAFFEDDSPEYAELIAQVDAKTTVESAEREARLAELDSTLTDEHAQQLAGIYDNAASNYEVRRAPQFELGKVQNYIIWRVFDLGWSSELFGQFDNITIGYHGREAHKVERIGKKYQWIAFHEMMAFLADHYQFYERFSSEEKVRIYEGPWQPSIRDLDPSNTLRSITGGTSWVSHAPAWWGQQEQGHWGEAAKAKDWVVQWQDLPTVENLLLVSRQEDSSQWLNAAGHFSWAEPTPPDLDSMDVEKRRIWYITTGYLVREDDVSAFMQWAETVDFLGQWMPDANNFSEMFLGEHSWSPASNYFQREYYDREVWERPRKDCPVDVQVIPFDYSDSSGGFDCSIDETVSLNLLRPELIEKMALRWTGNGADYVDAENRLVAFDPTVHQNGPTALLLREDFLRDFLSREKLSVCCTVIGAKESIGPGHGGGNYHRMNISGAYALSAQKVTGFLNCFLEGSRRKGQEGDVLLHTIRTSF